MGKKEHELLNFPFDQLYSFMNLKMINDARYAVEFSFCFRDGSVVKSPPGPPNVPSSNLRNHMVGRNHLY